MNMQTEADQATRFASVQVDPALAKALLRAQQRVHRIGKDGDAKQYKYTTTEYMVQVVGTALNLEGLALIRVGGSIGEWREQTITTKYDGDKTMPVANVHSTYLLVHEDGAALQMSIGVAAVAANGREADKASCAAMTEGLNYILRDTALVSRIGKDGSEQYDISGRPEIEGGQRQPDPQVEAYNRLGKAAKALGFTGAAFDLWLGHMKRGQLDGQDVKTLDGLTKWLTGQKPFGGNDEIRVFEEILGKAGKSDDFGRAAKAFGNTDDGMRALALWCRRTRDHLAKTAA